MEDEAQPVFWRMKPEVVEYREEWPRLFEQEKAFLEGKFACVLSQIEHFGSTSIPGMWAKPIIDMQCVALPMPPSAETLAALKELGYAHRPTEDVDRAEYMRFDKGDPVVTHCLHLRNTRAESAVSFRDYLRSHPEDVQRYSETKRTILSGKGITMKEYRQQKQAIIDDIFQKVKEWKASAS